MASLVDLKADLAAIESTLRKGVRSVTVDGTTTAIDLEHLRGERSRLKKQIGAQEGTMARPTIFQPDMSGGP